MFGKFWEFAVCNHQKEEMEVGSQGGRYNCVGSIFLMKREKHGIQWHLCDLCAILSVFKLKICKLKC